MPPSEETQAVPAPWLKPAEEPQQTADTQAEAPVTESAADKETQAVPAPAVVDEPVVGEVVEMVTVTVPKAFKLRLDNFREVQIKAGVQEMEREWVDHWYAKANGVVEYDRRAK